MAIEWQIEAALDERHRAANIAFANKDIAGYACLFGEGLQYCRLDGVVVDRSGLMRDVAAQFAKLDRAESSFTRESLHVDRQQVSETLSQIATAEASAFGLLRRTWRVERRGVYTWIIEDGHWRIVRVRVLAEAIHSRWSLGR